jgi:hypothetical protein
MTSNQCGKPFFSSTRQNGEWTGTGFDIHVLYRALKLKIEEEEINAALKRVLILLD